MSKEGLVNPSKPPIYIVVVTMSPQALVAPWRQQKSFGNVAVVLCTGQHVLQAKVLSEYHSIMI